MFDRIVTGIPLLFSKAIMLTGVELSLWTAVPGGCAKATAIYTHIYTYKIKSTVILHQLSKSDALFKRNTKHKILGDFSK